MVNFLVGFVESQFKLCKDMYNMCLSNHYSFDDSENKK